MDGEGERMAARVRRGVARGRAATAQARPKEPLPVALPSQDRSTIEDRVEGLRKRALRFPEGKRQPPHLDPLLPERLFPPLRDTPAPIQPLFPPPGHFQQDAARYVLPESGYGADTIRQERVNDMKKTTQMAKVTPTYKMDAAGEKRFFCANGEVFANLQQLHVGLLTMKDDHFRHHANETKNDFASWIAGVFGDQRLAKELGAVRSRALMAYKVGQTLKTVRAQKK